MIYRILLTSLLGVSPWLFGMENCIEIPLTQSGVSFRFEGHTGCGYQLHITTSQGNLIAEFYPAETRSEDRPFYAYAKSVAEKNVVDLWPLNGKCASDLVSLFSSTALRDLRTQAKVADTIFGAQVRLFVLDLKDSRGRYRNAGDITLPYRV